MMSGIRSQIVVKLYGRDMEELRDRTQDSAEIMVKIVTPALFHKFGRGVYEHRTARSVGGEASSCEPWELASQFEPPLAASFAVASRHGGNLLFLRLVSSTLQSRAVEALVSISGHSRSCPYRLSINAKRVD